MSCRCIAVLLGICRLCGVACGGLQWLAPPIFDERVSWNSGVALWEWGKGYLDDSEKDVRVAPY